MNSHNLIFKNRKASFNYSFSDKYTAGVVLKGSEIKSIKDQSVDFSNSYCIIKHNEIFIIGMNIKEYKFANLNNHDPDRDRKLLLNKKEINQIKKKVSEKKFSIIPTKLFMSSRGLVKIEIGLGKGKKEYDKREDIKQRDIDRRLRENI
mgnify:FL=1|tara:strand:- start:1908 stop:2354 length:447 start_codon:yes stop_codon:yes gene_type:complete